MTGFSVCFGLELRALLARRLTQVGFAVAVLVAGLGGAVALRRDAAGALQTVNGWRCLASGMRFGMPVAALVALVLGSQALAAAAAEGSLRATLCRPISRSAVIGAHAAALGVLGFALGLGVVAGAAAVGLSAGYGDVVTEYAGGRYPGPEGAAALMGRRALLLCAGAPLTLCTAAWCGLAVSALTDQPGAAAGAALLVGVPFGLAATQPHPAAGWLFLRPGLEIWSAFDELATGMATAGWHRVPLADALWVPAGTMVLAGGFAWWWFARRDVLS